MAKFTYETKYEDHLAALKKELEDAEDDVARCERNLSYAEARYEKIQREIDACESVMEDEKRATMTEDEIADDEMAERQDALLKDRYGTKVWLSIADWWTS